MTHKCGKHNNIPPAEYKKAEGVGDYVTWDQVENYHTADEAAVFNTWMDGQTVAVVNGEPAIYTEDYERWLRNLPVID